MTLSQDGGTWSAWTRNVSQGSAGTAGVGALNCWLWEGRGAKCDEQNTDTIRCSLNAGWCCYWALGDQLDPPGQAGSRLWQACWQLSHSPPFEVPNMSMKERNGWPVNNGDNKGPSDDHDQGRKHLHISWKTIFVYRHLDASSLQKGNPAPERGCSPPPCPCALLGLSSSLSTSLSTTTSLLETLPWDLSHPQTMERRHSRR